MIDRMTAATGTQPTTTTVATPRQTAPVEIRRQPAVIADKLANNAAGRATTAVALTGSTPALTSRQKTWIVVGVSLAGAAIGAAVGYFTGGRVQTGNQAVNRIVSAVSSGLMVGVGGGFFTAHGLKGK
jgi:hypothetical protein